LEFREAVGSTTVLRRAGTFTGDARWVSMVGLGHGAGLDDKLVIPAVAEVVFVADPRPDPRHVGEACLCLVRVSEFVLRIGTVGSLADLERVQMAVLPSHGGLDYPVDPAEGVGRR